MRMEVNIDSRDLATIMSALLSSSRKKFKSYPTLVEKLVHYWALALINNGQGKLFDNREEANRELKILEMIDSGWTREGAEKVI